MCFYVYCLKQNIRYIQTCKLYEYVCKPVKGVLKGVDIFRNQKWLTLEHWTVLNGPNYWEQSLNAPREVRKLQLTPLYSPVLRRPSHLLDWKLQVYIEFFLVHGCVFHLSEILGLRVILIQPCWNTRKCCFLTKMQTKTNRNINSGKIPPPLPLKKLHLFWWDKIKINSLLIMKRIYNTYKIFIR